MSQHPRDLIFEEFRQDAMEAAYEQQLFRDFQAASVYAAETGLMSDALFARKLYQRFMRSSLSEPERQVIVLEDRVRQLEAENAALRAAQRRPRIPVPQWREAPAAAASETDSAAARTPEKGAYQAPAPSTQVPAEDCDSASPDMPAGRAAT